MMGYVLGLRSQQFPKGEGGHLKGVTSPSAYGSNPTSHGGDKIPDLRIRVHPDLLFLGEKPLQYLL